MHNRLTRMGSLCLLFTFLSMSFVPVSAFASKTNAAVQYAQAINTIEPPSEALLSHVDAVLAGQAKPSAEFLAYCERNKAALDVYKEGAALYFAGFYSPGQDWKKVPPPHPPALLIIAKIVLAQGVAFFEAGELDAAVRNALFVVRTGYQIGRTPPIRPESRVLMHLYQGMGYPYLLKWMLLPGVSLATQRRIVFDLEDFKVHDPGIRPGVYSVRRILYVAAQDLAKEWHPDYEPMKPLDDDAEPEENPEPRPIPQQFVDKVLERLDVAFGYAREASEWNQPESYTEYMKQARQEAIFAANKAGVVIDETLDLLALLQAGTNLDLVAQLFVSLQLPEFEGLIREHYAILTYQRLLLTAGAMAMYVAAEKKVPRKSNVLYPNYLPEAFEDPSSKQPFVYKKKGKFWRLYSVGPNGKDETKRVRIKPDAVYPQDSDDLVLVGQLIKK